MLSEFALRRPIGGPAVMRAQLRQLVLITELPTVTVRVLPASVVLPEAMEGSLPCSISNPGQPSVAHTQTVFGPQNTDKPAQIEAARARVNYIRSRALEPEESVEFMDWMSEKVWRD